VGGTALTFTEYGAIAKNRYGVRYGNLDGWYKSTRLAKNSENDEVVAYLKNGTKKYTTEQIWFGYFNQALFEQGIISEADKNRMALKIESRKPPATTK